MKEPSESGGNAIRASGWFVCMAIYIAFAGCGDDSLESGSTAATDVVERDFSSTVDTLVLTLTAQLSGSGNAELQQYDGYFIDPGQIHQVKLLVNGEPWGVFETLRNEDRAEAEVNVDGWRLTSEPRQALVVAVIGEEAENGKNKPGTIGEWVDLMQRFLPPGGYVAEIAEVILRNDHDETVTLKPGTLVSFNIDDRDTSSTLGEVRVTFADLAGAS